MAGKTITQRIALEGGKAIEAQLKAIGDAGTKAFTQLSAAANASSGFQRLGASIDAVTARLKAFGGEAQKVRQQFGNLEQAVLGSVRNLGIAAGSIALAGAGIQKTLRGAGDSADTLEEVGASVGLAAEEFSTLRFAAEQSGLGEDKFTRALTKLNGIVRESGDKQDDLRKKQGRLFRELQGGEIDYLQYNKRLRDMRDEAASSASPLQKLGVSIRNVDGSLREGQGILLDFADAVKDIENPLERVNTVMQVVGTKNARAVNFFAQGADGIRKLQEEAKRIAPPLTALEISIGQTLNDSFDKLSRASASLKDSFVLLFAPSVTGLVNSFIEAIVRNRAAILQFGLDIATKARPIIADFIALLDGRDKDVKNGFFIKARDGVIAFGIGVQKTFNGIVVPAFTAFLAVLDQVAVAMNKLFGTELTGGQLATILLVTKLLGGFRLLGAAIGVVATTVRGLVLLFSVGLAAVPGIIAVAQIAFAGLVSAVGLLVTILASPIGIIIALGLAIGFLVVTALAKLGLFSGGWSEVWKNLKQIASDVWEAIKAKTAEGFQVILSWLGKIVQPFVDAWTAIRDFVTGVWDWIVSKATGALDSVKGVFNDALSFVTGIFTDWRDKILGVFDSIIAGAKRVIAAVKAATGGSGDGTETTGFARGGHVRGPGSSRSDSIPARLSDGEFVQPARSVQGYGVAFMEAIRRMQIPIEKVRALMQGRGFNMGGLAHAASSFMPSVSRFADGGLATAQAGSGSLRPVNVNIGGESFPMMGGSDVVGQLQRYASRKSLRSAGRKPTWYRG